MNDDLLLALRKYMATNERDPLENFLTEAFAWILTNYPEISRCLLDFFLKNLNFEFNTSKAIWSTQVYFWGNVSRYGLCQWGKRRYS
jgi:hypothetical protein